MSPKISVVMCCYNSEEHIKKAIDSILCQTFYEFEFIIWDDGSTDQTHDIVLSYEDKRIRYFYHENTGLGQALRMACSKVESPIIARMDSDDYALPNRLETEYNYLQEHKDVVLISSAVNYMDDNDNIIGSSFPYTDYRIIHRIMQTGRSVIVHPASMFRKDAYEKAGGYYPLKKAQDSLLFSKMMKFGKLSIHPKPLLNYRISLNSISSQTEGSPYDSIILQLRKKMIYDYTICDEDIEIYNKIVILAKKLTKSKVTTINEKRQSLSLEMRLYNFLVSFLGPNLSRSIIISLKNTIKKSFIVFPFST